MDIVVHRQDYELVAATHGQSIFVLDVKKILSRE